MSRTDHLNHVIEGDNLTGVYVIREFCIALDEAIQDRVPQSREKALALTKLEECRMWAIKGIAMQGPGQEFPPVTIARHVHIETGAEPGV